MGLHLPQQDRAGKWETVWGWPSLFTNPNACGHAFPKAPCHVFDMVSRLAGQRIESTRAGATVNSFACASPEQRQMQVLVWNYGARIPEGGLVQEKGAAEAVRLQVVGAADFFGGGGVRVQRWLVSETVSNAHYLFRSGQALDDRASLQRVQDDTARPAEGHLEVGFPLPPSSVTLVLLTRQPWPHGHSRAPRELASSMGGGCHVVCDGPPASKMAVAGAHRRTSAPQAAAAYCDRTATCTCAASPGVVNTTSVFPNTYRSSSGRPRYGASRSRTAGRVTSSVTIHRPAPVGCTA